MSRPLRCPCGGTARATARRPRCLECDRLLTRPAAGRWWLLATLVGVTAATGALGAVALRARSRPAEHAAAPEPPGARSEIPVTPAPPPATEAVSKPPARPDAVVPSPAPIPELPQPVPAVRPATPVGILAPESPGRYRVGEVIEQEVSVSRRSAFRVLGAGAPQAAEYTFTSRLTVEAVGRDGSLTVKQRVEAARLTACDPAMRELMEDALRKTKGAAFEIAVGPRGEVTGLTGPADPVRVRAGNDPLGAETTRVWSLLDADGWKELAGLTFFQPDRPLAAGEKWTRPLAHSWGPLGGWAGRTTYTAVGRRDGAERVEYAHEMTYRPPDGDTDLPFRVLRADFRRPAAGGTIRYDVTRGRVTAAEEAFRVRGTLVVSAGGVEAPVEVDEVQGFRLRILDPGAPALEGRSPPR